MKRRWYEIRNQAEGAEIFIYDEIGMWGITANDFVRDLRDLRGQTLDVYINSPGGEVFDGLAIYNALTKHDSLVNTTVDALAASIASVIAQAGNTRSMVKSAALMIHEPHGLALGTREDMQKMIEMLDTAGDQIAGVYADRAGGTVEEWRSRMADETWYKAEAAVEAGLADEVGGEEAEAKMAAYAGRVFNLSKYQNVPDWVKQQKGKPRDAGRTMSQANLDGLHSAIGQLGTVHGAVCDMGDGCPMDGDASAALELVIRAEDVEAAIENAMPKLIEGLKEAHEPKTPTSTNGFNPGEVIKEAIAARRKGR
jgi:ATP-dependent protease ClpP protease subunit